MVIDARQLNKVLVRTPFPYVPIMAQIKDIPRDHLCFQKVDIVKGYWTIPYDKRTVDSGLTTFQTAFGSFQALRAIMGVNGSSDSFTGYIASILEPFRDNVKQIIDDILCHGRTPQECAEVYGKVLAALDENNLKIQEHKSQCADLRKCADTEKGKQSIIFGGIKLIRDEAGGLGSTMDPK